MPFEFAQAEQMLKGSCRQTFTLKVSLKTWRLCLQAKNVTTNQKFKTAEVNILFSS